MGAAAFDNLTPHPSLLSRRAAAAAGGAITASGLPSFELPHPQVSSSSSLSGQKYLFSSNTGVATSPQQHSTTHVRVGSLLAPSNHTSDGSSLSPLNPFSLASNQFPAYPQGYWAGSGGYPFNGRNNSSNEVSNALSSYNHYQSPVTSTSTELPSSSHHHNHSQHQPDQHTSQENQHQHQHSPHQQPPSHPQSPQNQQSPSQPPHQQQPMVHVMMNTSNPGSVSGTPQQQNQGLDAYGQQQKIYGHSTSNNNGPGQPHSPNPQQHQHHLSQPQPQQPHPSSYASYPPHSLHPQTVSSAARISPIPAQYPQFTRPYPSYSLPAMTGPIMSNVHNPNSQMALLGPPMQQGLLPGFNSGHAAAASMNHMYGAHGPPHGHPAHPHHAMHGLMQQAGGPQTDRPFRCDSCPQSFSRNHDLKRHKRIHLAVKPFPCTHCDKSFSRKDALKRHILVKGCGRDQAGDNAPASATSATSSNLKDDDGSSVDRHRLSSHDTI